MLEILAWAQKSNFFFHYCVIIKTFFEFKRARSDGISFYIREDSDSILQADKKLKEAEVSMASLRETSEGQLRAGVRLFLCLHSVIQVN